jgi:hypothetical protein
MGHPRVDIHTRPRPGLLRVRVRVWVHPQVRFDTRTRTQWVWHPRAPAPTSRTAIPTTGCPPASGELDPTGRADGLGCRPPEAAVANLPATGELRLRVGDGGSHRRARQQQAAPPEGPRWPAHGGRRLRGATTACPRCPPPARCGGLSQRPGGRSSLVAITGQKASSKGRRRL